MNERLSSSVLNLELGERDGVLGLYDPAIEQWLEPPQERAEQAEERAEQEALAREHAESELAKALATLERLQAEDRN
ncbi:hypothetical protein F4Y59_13865 [Candidatus Poribacteria bacterium]|nr:hypothetical protein [Candidatus Poribacteria bacterium]